MRGSRSRKDELKNFFSGVCEWGSVGFCFFVFLFRPGLMCLGGGIVLLLAVDGDALHGSSVLSLGWRRGRAGSRGCTELAEAGPRTTQRTRCGENGAVNSRRRG